MTNLMLNCLFLTFSNVRLFQLYGTDYNFDLRTLSANFETFAALWDTLYTKIVSLKINVIREHYKFLN